MKKEGKEEEYRLDNIEIKLDEKYSSPFIYNILKIDVKNDPARSCPICPTTCGCHVDCNEDMWDISENTKTLEHVEYKHLDRAA